MLFRVHTNEISDGRKCLSDKLIGVKESRDDTVAHQKNLGEEKDLPMLNGLQSRSVTTLSPAT